MGKAKSKTKEPDELVTVTVKMPVDLRDRVARQALRNDRPASWVINDALVRQLEVSEKQQQFMDEARQAWEHYEATGEHKTTAQMRKFVDGLKSKKGRKS